MNEDCMIGLHEFITIHDDYVACYKCGFPKPDESNKEKLSALKERYNDLKKQIQDYKLG